MKSSKEPELFSLVYYKRKVYQIDKITRSNSDPYIRYNMRSIYIREHPNTRYTERQHSLTSNQFTVMTSNGGFSLLEEFEKLLEVSDCGTGQSYISQDLPPIPNVEEDRVAKDGDPIEWHENHNVVNTAAGSPGNEIKYSYCRDCKVEVKKNVKVPTYDVNPKSYLYIQTGHELELYALQYGIQRLKLESPDIWEDDQSLRNRILEYWNINKFEKRPLQHGAALEVEDLDLSHIKVVKFNVN